MNIDIAQIIELDRLNMASIIEDTGGKFDWDRRQEGLLAEIEKGASFIIVEREGRIIAYIEYIPEQDRGWKVASIQMHPKYKGGFVLRQMLSQVYDKLKSDCPPVIRASVHSNNKASIKLHNKLGFREMTQNEGRILFEIGGKELLDLDNITVFLKK